MSTRRCRRSGMPHKINEPMLLIHGEADDNSGTFPSNPSGFTWH